MKQIKIRDKEYNCSNKVYYHIQGLESENRVISMELLGHENNELQQQKEIERLNNIINKAIEDKKIEKLERFIPQKESDTYCTKYNEVADKINEIIDKINAGVDKE